MLTIPTISSQLFCDTSAEQVGVLYVGSDNDRLIVLHPNSSEADPSFEALLDRT